MHALANAIKNGKVLVMLNSSFSGEFMANIGAEKVVFEPNKPINLFQKFTGGELMNSPEFTEALIAGTLRLL